MAPGFQHKTGQSQGRTMNVDTVIFDIDGTLLDSIQKYFNCMDTVLKKTFGRTFPREAIEATFGLPMRAAMPVLGIADEDVSVLESEVVSYICNLDEEIAFYPGIVETVSELRDQGFRLGIATSRTLEEVHGDKNIKGIISFFDAVSATSSEVRPKPAPDILLRVLDDLSAEPGQAVYIGDTRLDCLCARSAGTHFIGAGWNRDSCFGKKTDLYADCIICTCIDDLIKLIRML